MTSVVRIPTPDEDEIPLDAPVVNIGGSSITAFTFYDQEDFKDLVEHELLLKQRPPFGFAACKGNKIASGTPTAPAE